MQKAHCLAFVIVRASLDDRADQDLQKPAAHCVEHDGEQDAQKRVGKQLGQYGDCHKACGAQTVCEDGSSPVSDPVHEEHRKQINGQLQAEIDCNQKRYLGKRDPIGFLKGQKEERSKIHDDCLHKITDEACIHGMAVRESFHGVYSQSVPARSGFEKGPLSRRRMMSGGREQASTRKSCAECFDGYSSVAPSARMFRTWQEPFPNTCSMPLRYASVSPVGTNA